MRVRQNRVSGVAQKILAYNICSKTLDNEGMDYLVRNESVAKDVVMFFGCCERENHSRCDEDQFK